MFIQVLYDFTVPHKQLYEQTLSSSLQKTHGNLHYPVLKHIKSSQESLVLQDTLCKGSIAYSPPYVLLFKTYNTLFFKTECKISAVVANWVATIINIVPLCTTQLVLLAIWGVQYILTYVQRLVVLPPQDLHPHQTPYSLF